MTERLVATMIVVASDAMVLIGWLEGVGGWFISPEDEIGLAVGAIRNYAPFLLVNS